MSETFDLTNLSSREERLRIYAALRDRAPLYDTVINNVPVRIVSRYADVDALLKSPTALVQKQPGKYPAHIGDGAASVFYKLSLPHMDAPEHSRFRRIAMSAFNPASIARMTEWVRAIVETRLDAVAGLGDFDAVALIAKPIPADVACALLHIPRADAELMLARVHDLNPIVGQGPHTPEILAKADAAAQFYFDYFAKHTAEISDLPEDDLLHILIKAERDGLWDKTALATTLIGLFIAGYHTTLSSIANTIHALATNPDQFAVLKADPSLAERAWEEVLRYDTPAHFVHRYPSEVMRLADQLVQPGTRLLLALGSANLDSAQFPDAEKFDIRRPPGRHLAFAAGAHFCLGAQLSRLEGKFLLRGLAERFSQIALSGDAPVDRHNEMTFPLIRKLEVSMR